MKAFATRGAFDGLSGGPNVESSFVTAQRERRRRGSVYIAVLGAAVIVTIIGLSALLAGRLQHRRTRETSDLAEARFHALSAIDWGLLVVKQKPATWRTKFDAWAGGSLMTQALGAGSFDLEATDPVDGDLTDNSTDPVVLTGIGFKGQARYKLQVRLESNGSVTPGTFRQVVD